MPLSSHKVTHTPLQQHKVQHRNETMLLIREDMSCLSFRNFAAESNLNHSFHVTDASNGADEVDFEFVPVEIDLNLHRPFLYPVFGVNKMKEEDQSDSDSSTQSDDLDPISPDNYCLWSPKKKVIEKCKSTGSCSSKKWRLRDLVMIGRSKSDGKEKFLFLSTKTTSENTTPVVKKNGCKGVERRRADGKGGERRISSTTTFLPYRNELVSLFPARRSALRGKY